MSTLKSTFKTAQLHAKPDQQTQTSIAFLRLIQSTKPTTLKHGVLKPSFCLILSGEKQIQIGTKIIRYGAGDYLVSTIEMPTVGRIKGATPKNPYLGLSISIDPKEITDIVSEAEVVFEASSKNNLAGAFVSKSDNQIREACDRLVQLLTKTRPSKFLAAQIKREILYHLLTGQDGARFYQNLVTQQSVEGVSRAANWIKSNLDKPLKVSALAIVAGMSVSSLHHKFKSITTQGPLQYQKQLRLLWARQLLLTGAVNVTQASDRVGYSSSSQFTREYRRFFGQAPLKDIQKLKTNGNNTLQD